MTNEELAQRMISPTCPQRPKAIADLIKELDRKRGSREPAAAMGDTPGSPEAVENGCVCPVEDNDHGRGFRPPHREGVGAAIFWIDDYCQLHATRAGFEPHPLNCPCNWCAAKDETT